MPSYTKFVLLFACLLVVSPLAAHSINYAMANAPAGEVLGYYLQLGFSHILPFGADHILFVVGLCLLSTNFKTMLWQATAFTVAHSITLALSLKNIVMAPSAIVEPLISLSILFIAAENLFAKKLQPWRMGIVFLFGLVHGMGFASSLNEIGLPPGKFFTSVFAFNLGVELGQATVIAAVFCMLVLPSRHRPWYRVRIVYPLSALIMLAALYWTFERL